MTPPQCISLPPHPSLGTPGCSHSGALAHISHPHCQLLAGFVMFHIILIIFYFKGLLITKISQGPYRGKKKKRRKGVKNPCFSHQG